MTKNEKTINISHELNHAKSTYISDLERASQYSSISEQFSKLSSEFQLPESSLDYHFGFGQYKNQSDLNRSGISQDVLNNFYEYSTRFAVIVMITSSEIYLTRLLWLAKLCNYLKLNDDLLTTDLFYELGFKAKKEARYSSVPRLVDIISKELDADFSSENLPLFKSIYNARNCLAHRGGEISTDDVDKNGKFILLWKRFNFSVDGDPVETIKGLTLEAGSKIGFHFELDQREFAIGERLILSAQDCQNIALTLAAFSEDIRQFIDNCARDIIHPA